MWNPYFQKIEFVTVEQMFQFAQPNTPLLSNYEGTFWNEYRNNHLKYDKVFRRLYKNFYYFNQDANLTAAQVTPNFIDDVYGVLLANSKRYDELYRINLINDQDYSILDNYNITETREGGYTKSITDNYGQQIDTTDEEKALTDVYGQRIASNQSTIGSQQNTATEQVAPYDSEQFSNQNKADTTLGQRQDSSSTTQNTVTDTHTTETDGTVTRGEREDTHKHEGTDSYEFHRKGNIGVQTQAEVMQKHIDFWKGFSFYKLVFDDICSELLLIQKGYLD